MYLASEIYLQLILKNYNPSFFLKTAEYLGSILKVASNVAGLPGSVAVAVLRSYHMLTMSFIT